ncbi:hypothetical protein MCFN_02325 [Mycoplasmopsis californica]|uniref:Uncharacterized protein n=1 Tax=Mycoplasmopsis californica TaxID=2113 RepID=A0A059XRD0_9BACT|nr:hypothetical protein [Mycoplasmopsis californica]AIA29600.1 hypothetical protein MCFN_02325 [Mycoplasmopsis californica]
MRKKIWIPTTIAITTATTATVVAAIGVGIWGKKDPGDSKMFLNRFQYLKKSPQKIESQPISSPQQNIATPKPKINEEPILPPTKIQPQSMDEKINPTPQPNRTLTPIKPPIITPKKPLTTSPSRVLPNKYNPPRSIPNEPKLNFAPPAKPKPTTPKSTIKINKELPSQPKVLTPKPKNKKTIAWTKLNPPIPIEKELSKEEIKNGLIKQLDWLAKNENNITQQAKDEAFRVLPKSNGIEIYDTKLEILFGNDKYEPLLTSFFTKQWSNTKNIRRIKTLSKELWKAFFNNESREWLGGVENVVKIIKETSIKNFIDKWY